MDKHRNLIRQICNYYSNDTYHFEDLVQECFIALSNGYNNFANRSKESTWIYKVCQNTCRRLIRESIKYNIVPLSDLLIQNHTIIPENEIQEDITWIRDTIEALPPIEKEIIILRSNGHSYDEIAEKTGMLRNTIATKLRRIRYHLLSRFH